MTVTSAIDKELYDNIWLYLRDNFYSTGLWCMEGIDSKINPQTAEEYSEVLAETYEELLAIDLNEYDRDEAIEAEREDAHDHGRYSIDQNVLDAISERYPDVYFDDVMKDEFGIIFEDGEPLLNVQAEIGVGKSRKNPSEIVDFAKCKIGDTELYSEFPVDNQGRNIGKLNSDLYGQIEEMFGNSDSYHLDYGKDIFSKFRSMSKEDKINSAEGIIPESAMADAELSDRASIADKIREMADVGCKPVLIDKDTYNEIFDYMRERFEHSDLFFLQYYDREIAPVIPEEYTEVLTEFAKAVEGVDLNEESRDIFIDNHREHAEEYRETESDIEIAAYDTYPEMSFKEVLRSEFGLDIKNDRFVDVRNLSERTGNISRPERDDSEVLNAL